MRLKRWTALGATLVEFDLEPFYETARLLYEGPWVAERYLVIRDLLASAPDIDPSRDARDHRGRRAADGGGHLLRALSLAGPAQDRRAHLHQYRRAGAADRADGLYDRAGAGQSGRAQQPARHLHQFRQSARPLRSRGAGVDAHRRHSVRHHAARARRPRCAAREHRPRIPCRYETDRLARRAWRSPAGAARRKQQSTRFRSPWSARISPAWR